MLVDPTFSAPVELKSAGNRDKIYIDLFPESSNPNSIRIRIRFLLNPTVPEQAVAMEKFGNLLEVDCDVTENLSAERDQITGAINALFNNEKTLSIIRRSPLHKLTDDDVSLCFSEIAKYGAALYFRLFWELKSLQGIGSTARPIAREAIRSAFLSPHVLCIQSPISLFPWNFLFLIPKYDAKDPLDLKHFLGFRHEVQEQLDGTAATIDLHTSPSVVKAICTDLDKHQWHDHKSHALKKCCPLPAIVSAQEFGDKLGDFQDDCFYFFGHAFHADPPTPATSRLSLNHQDLTVDALGRIHNAPKYRRDLVVGFLNGCSTAPLHEWSDNSVVGFLCRRSDNRLCCVSTTTDLPAEFGAEFANEFWQRFIFDKLPISKALVDARLAMLGKYNNPLGLMYVLYGRADTHC